VMCKRCKKKEYHLIFMNFRVKKKIIVKATGKKALIPKGPRVF
jgi:hypothetical protein